MRRAHRDRSSNAEDEVGHQEDVAMDTVAVNGAREHVHQILGQVIEMEGSNHEA